MIAIGLLLKLQELVKHSYDFKNKKVGLIGGGLSGVQILPSLQQIEGTQISNFVRAKVWLAGAFFDTTMEQLGLDPKVLSCKSLSQEKSANQSRPPMLPDRSAISSLISRARGVRHKSGKIRSIP